jgi:hypothetical protein
MNGAIYFDQNQTPTLTPSARGLSFQYVKRDRQGQRFAFSTRPHPVPYRAKREAVHREFPLVQNPLEPHLFDCVFPSCCKKEKCQSFGPRVLRNYSTVDNRQTVCQDLGKPQYVHIQNICFVFVRVRPVGAVRGCYR